MAASKKDQAQISLYSRRLKENVKCIVDNYADILRTSKVEEGQQRVSESQVAHVENEMRIRAANIVRAAESLSKLVSDLKEFLILNDFSTINEATTQRVTDLRKLKDKVEEEVRSQYRSHAERVSAVSQEHSGGEGGATDGSGGSLAEQRTDGSRGGAS